MNILNTKLCELADIAFLMGYMRSQNCLSADLIRRFDESGGTLLRIITAVRKLGCHWLWDYHEINEDLKDSQGTTLHWTLPSAEVTAYLDDVVGKPLESHNQIEEVYTALFGVDKDIMWDTERSAIYPQFRSREAAVRFIDNMDKWMDEALLPPKSVSPESDTTQSVQ